MTMSTCLYSCTSPGTQHLHAQSRAGALSLESRLVRRHTRYSCMRQRRARRSRGGQPQPANANQKRDATAHHGHVGHRSRRAQPEPAARGSAENGEARSLISAAPSTATTNQHCTALSASTRGTSHNEPSTARHNQKQGHNPQYNCRCHNSPLMSRLSPVSLHSRESHGEFLKRLRNTDALHCA